MPLRIEQIEALQQRLAEGVPSEDLQRAFSISASTVEKYRKLPKEQVPSSKEWVCVQTLAEKHHRDVSHLFRVLRTRGIARLQFHGLSYVKRTDAEKLFLPDAQYARMKTLKDACNELGIDYNYILSEFASRGRITTYRELKRHLVDPVQLKKELEALGMVIGIKSVDEPMLLADAARALGRHPVGLSKMASEGKIKSPWKVGGRYMVRLEVLKEELGVA